MTSEGPTERRGAWVRVKAGLMGEPRREPQDEAIDTLDLAEYGHGTVQDRYRPPVGEPPRRTGICCSGGGIRSAAFNLGALQVLRREGELARARYLAAVSGGSYIAAAHVATAAELRRDPASEPDPARRAEARLAADPELFTRGPAPWAPGSPEERHLRNHSKYLTEGGAIWLLMNVVFGLLTTAGPLLAGTFLVGRTLGAAMGRVHPRLGDEAGFSASLPTLYASLGVVLIGFLLLAVHRRAQTYGGRVGRAQIYALQRWAKLAVLAGAALAVLGVALPELLGYLRSHDPQVEVGGATIDSEQALPLLTLGCLSGALGAVWRMRRQAARFAPLVVNVLGPLILLVPLVTFTYQGAYHGLAGGGRDTFWASGDEAGFSVGAVRVSGAALVVAVAVLVLLNGFFGHNVRSSLHLFYKERLSSVFMMRRRWATEDRRVMEVEEIPYESEVRMSDMAAARADGAAKMPELVICATLNVSERVVPPGRAGESFTFSPTESGSVFTGYHPTSELERHAGAAPLTLPAMIAISGAAVAPSMGRMTRGWARFVLAVLNVRLGVWIPNPTRWDRLPVAEHRLAPDERRRGLGRLRSILVRGWKEPGPLYVLYEAFGLNTLNRDFVYVTDGGHWENLGLVELLRRRCTEIVCFDAAGDDLDHFTTLGQAMALARAELQVEIDIDPVRDGLKPGESGFSETDNVRGTIRYPDGTEGILVFVKAAMAADAPWDVKAYRDSHPGFPCEGTLDQLFDDGQFQAYQALGAAAGRHAVTTLHRARAEGDDGPAVTGSTIDIDGIQGPAKRVGKGAT